MKQTAAQILLGIHLKELGLGPIEYEFCFNPLRKWRADVAIPSQHLLFECDGGSFKGGHKRGLALGADYERQNWAQMVGYRILRFTNEQVLTGEAIKFLAEHLKLAHETSLRVHGDTFEDLLKELSWQISETQLKEASWWHDFHCGERHKLEDCLCCQRIAALEAQAAAPAKETKNE